MMLLVLSGIQFDWEGDMHLKLSQKDLVIYEMHVRGFTRHESSKIEFPGTYQGVAEKLDHLQVLASKYVPLIKKFKYSTENKLTLNSF